MGQIASRLRFLCLAGSLPFHEPHENRLGEEKAKSNLKTSESPSESGQLPLLRLGRSNLIAKRWITHYALCMLFASKLAVVRPLMLSLVVCSQLGAARAQANSPFTRAHNQGNELISLIHDAASTTAIVHYMERSDQTLASRRDLLQSVRVARSHNREIGRNVAAYAETSDEGLNVDAIETLGAMGTAVVSDHRQWLTDVAADDERGSAMRSAAKNVLASVP